MRTNKKNSKIDWLVGRWQSNEGQIAVIFVVKKTSKGFRVQAFDESDGEELIISKVMCNETGISFETRTPSNNWRTKNRLVAVSKSKAIHELTFWDVWKKIA